MTAVGLYATL